MLAYYLPFLLTSSTYSNTTLKEAHHATSGLCIRAARAAGAGRARDSEKKGTRYA